MKVAAIIPARYGSTRLNGKALRDISGKPMVQWVYESADRARLINDVLVATDDKRIFDAVQGFGGKVVMTSESHRSGTDRLAEAASNLSADIIVNVQGDEPLIDSAMIDEAVMPLVDNAQIVMSTVKNRITDEHDLKDPNVVKVVTDKDGFALYFSRLPIPYVREQGQGARGNGQESSALHYKHIGLYAYRKDFLLQFAQMEPSPLEEAEKLEQLRALENGFKIKVIETEYQSIGVDTAEDLEKVRGIFSQMY